MKPASGAGEAEQVVGSVVSTSNRALNSWSPDGRYLLYQNIDAVTGGDLWVVPAVKDSVPRPFLKTRFNEFSASFSPDGRWVAYSSDETGRYEIYVRPIAPPRSGAVIPEAGAGKWQVSTAGGVFPAWRRDGREIYYLSAADAMMAVPVAFMGAAIEAGTPMELFRTRVAHTGNGESRQYDVAADGRFLVSALPNETGSSPITLILNWNPDANKQ
jgi:Tol biopolymer transport system component